MLQPVSTIKTLSMLHLSLLVGQGLFAVIAGYLIYSKTFMPDLITGEFVTIYSAAAIVVSATIILLAFFIYKKKVEKIRNNEEAVAKKLSAYRAASIIRWSMMEAATLLLIVSFMLTGSYNLLLLTGLTLLIFIYTKPSAKKMMQDLTMSEEEVNE